MKIKEIGFESADWNRMAQNRAQWRGSCGHGTESSGSIKSREICWPASQKGLDFMELVMKLNTKHYFEKNYTNQLLRMT
jgi:hypothetical protein